MLTSVDLRKGWCPGALAPMPAKDGLLVRLRISGGIVSADALATLARAGRDHGNGLFDLSSRGNLQLRGISPTRLPLLHARLEDLGLLDADSAAEAIRNVLLSPVCGLDAPVDIGPIGKALEAELVRADDLRGLPGKFGFLIDDGGPLSLAHTPADIRFDYDRRRGHFAIGVGGAAREAYCLGACEPEAIVDIALRLARAFRRLGGAMPEAPRRMRDLLRRQGPEAVGAAAGLDPTPAPKGAPAAEPCPIGLIRLGDDKFCFGVGAPFGRFTAPMIEAAARAAALFTEGEIRLTPWRALILPGADARRYEALRAHFATQDFILDKDDPRLAVAACGGADACERGSTPTHADALALAPLARRLRGTGVALHVSGCAKGCARQSKTPYALVANGGRYDLAVDAASLEPNRATYLAKGLSLTMAQRMLESMLDPIAQKNAQQAERNSP
jgi:precorrin-3B synthase